MIILISQAIASRIRTYLRAPTSLVLELLYIGFMLTVIIGSASSGHQRSAVEASVIGFLVWMMFTMVAMSGAEWIASEAAQGKLERVLSGPRPHIAIVASEILGSGIVGLFRCIVAAAVTLSVLRIHLERVRTDVYVVFMLFVFYLFVALALAGLALVRRSTSMVQSFMQMGMLGVALLANDASGRSLNALAWFPFTNGILMLTGRASDVHTSMMLMALTVLFSGISAICIFAFCDESALKRGSLLST